MENTDTQAAEKGRSPMKRLQNFLYYYKWLVLAAALILIVLGAEAVSRLTEKQTVLTGVMLNCHVSISGEEKLEEFSQAFLEQNGLDTQENQLGLLGSLTYFSEFETSPTDTYYSVQAISAQITAGSLDFVAGDQESIQALAYGDFFEDLSQVLPADVLKALEPHLLYMDLAVMERMQATDWTQEENEEVLFPDPTDPAAMEKPIPVMVDISGSPALRDIYLKEGAPLAFAVAGNAPHTQWIDEMLDFLLR